MIGPVATGEDLRAAMRRFPFGVGVLTVDANGQRFGITVGSLVSLSLDPPLVGVSIGHASAMHELLREAGEFAVSLLAGDQAALAQHFARSGVPPIALWAGVALRESELEEPLVADALAWLACRTIGECDAGDHTIFVGAVESVTPGREAPALVYVRSEYGSV